MHSRWAMAKDGGGLTVSNEKCLGAERAGRQVRGRRALEWVDSSNADLGSFIMPNVDCLVDSRPQTSQITLAHAPACCDLAIQHSSRVVQNLAVRRIVAVLALPNGPSPALPTDRQDTFEG